MEIREEMTSTPWPNDVPRRDNESGGNGRR